MSPIKMVLVSVGMLILGFGGGYVTAHHGSLPTFNLPKLVTHSSQEVNYRRALQVADQAIYELKTEVEDLKSRPPKTVYVQPSPVPAPDYAYANLNADFTGEDLLQAVNKYRREHGVPELQLHGELCQLASKRLGQILDLGKLDNHAGFEAYFQDKTVNDLGLSAVAENLASGYSTAWDTVMGWDGSPPHRTFLLTDGSYIHGCTAANIGFSVLIAGY